MLGIRNILIWRGTEISLVHSQAEIISKGAPGNKKKKKEIMKGTFLIN